MEKERERNLFSFLSYLEMQNIEYKVQKERKRDREERSFFFSKNIENALSLLLARNPREGVRDSRKKDSRKKSRVGG